MPRKSKIKELPPEILDAVNEAIRNERATLDDIVAMIREMGGEASRTSVHRYRKKFEDVAQRMREATEIAKVWVDRLGKEPEGELGRLVIEMIRTVAFQVAMEASETDGGTDPKDVMLLAKAMDHLSRSSKASAELTLRLRREFAAEAAGAAEEAAIEAGLSADTVDAIKRKILGVRGGGAASA